MRYLDSGINIVFASLGEAIQNNASLGFRTRLLHVVRNDGYMDTTPLRLKRSNLNYLQ